MVLPRKRLLTARSLDELASVQNCFRSIYKLVATTIITASPPASISTALQTTPTHSVLYILNSLYQNPSCTLLLARHTSESSEDPTHSFRLYEKTRSYASGRVTPGSAVLMYQGTPLQHRLAFIAQHSAPGQVRRPIRDVIELQVAELVFSIR